MSVQYLYKSSPTGEGLFYAWFSAMHTRVDVAMYGDRPENEWIAIGEQIEATIRQLESIGNCYDAHSELALANRQAAIQPVALSNELYDMLAICKRYHAETMGCFDVTILSENHNRETMNCVHLSEDAHTLYYSSPGISINLSGFIKGYALERIKQLLHEHGVANALVNLGNSSILAMGNHPNGEGWKVDEYTLHNQCLTTSGNDTDARKHIISPQTGKWVEGQGKVSVITENAYIGEIYSTALFAATEEQRICLMRSADAPILFHRFTE